MADTTLQTPAAPVQVPLPATPSLTPTPTPNVVSAPNLATPPVNIPPPSQNLLPNAAQGLVSSVQGQLDAATADTNRYQSLVDQKLSEASNLNTDVGNQGQFQVGQEAALGVPQYQKQLADINTSIAQKTAAFQQGTAQIQNDSIFSGFAEGEKGRLHNVAAAQIGALSSVAQALQGNISAAQTQAQHSTDLMYKPKIAQLQNAINFIAQNRDSLTASQKKQAALQSQNYEAQLKQVEYAQTDHINALTMLGQSAQNGAPQDLLTKLAQDPNLSTAKVLSQIPNSYIGTGKFGSLPYGGTLYNRVTGQAPNAGGVTSSGASGGSTSSSGVVGGYDISTYATNPKNAEQVANLLQNIKSQAGGTIASAQSANAVLQNLTPGSPITGDMVMAAAHKTGVDASMLIAMTMNESVNGTSTVASSNNNLAGITWTGSQSQVAQGMTKGSARPASEGGNYAKFPDMQSGLNALAQNLAGRKVTPPSFNEYGLLSTTDINTKSQGDKMALSYLNQVLSGTNPPRTTGSLAGQMQANAADRAASLYTQATGQPLPNPTILKGNLGLINANNKLLNSNVIQADTVDKNMNLAISGMKAGNINQSYTFVNSIVNSVNQAIGDPATVQAMISNGTIGKELGNLLSIKNAGGTTVSDSDLGAKLIDKNAPVATQIASLQRLVAEAKNIHGAVQTQNYSLYAQTDPLMKDPSNPIRPAAKAVISGQPVTLIYPDGSTHTGVLNSSKDLLDAIHQGYIPK